MDVGCSFCKGIATKYAEGLLAIKYRECDEMVRCVGDLCIIEKGTGNNSCKIICFLGCSSLLGIGTFGQVKSIADAVTISFNIPPRLQQL